MVTLVSCSPSTAAKMKEAFGSLPLTAKLKRSHPSDEPHLGGLVDEHEFAYIHAKKMLSGVSNLHGNSMSNGTSPSSLCSTPISILQQQMMPLMQANPFATNLCDMQLQPQLGNAYEGIPIFIVPQNGVGPSSVSLAALQRAAEIKAALANTPQEPKVDTSKHYHIFVGDLSPEVDNRAMKEAFSVYGEVSEAKVIRDAQTQKSKGYGFVSFPSKENAEKAMSAMNGQWLGRRPIRTNWATRRPADEAREKLTFEQVFNSTKPDNTSVYVGNVSQCTTGIINFVGGQQTSFAENDLREPFAVHGEITEVRLFKAQGYAFVRFEKKECATNAIMDMNGKDIGGNTIRCSWGRIQQAATTQIMPDLTTMLAQTLMPAPVVPPVFYNPYFQQIYNPTIIPQWQA